ncbi:MAG: 4-phosphoerythronate dehydrogenase [Colwellia sp.]|jgi:erythronate-4-phosphate dehydrogenase|nr:4-phosphoerythronate dehydrogenase [Colwellia sp.]
MKILFDENMPYAKEFFSDIVVNNTELIAFSGRDLSAKQVLDADVLLVRSITQVDEALLNKNQKLSFVGTATIGTDHIDQNYLAQRDIAFHSAPGCNAVSVAEYVISALVILAERYLLDLTKLSVGIIGGGNTGTRLSEKLSALGIQYKICDPLLAADINDNREFVSLEEALQCDVISLHVPKVIDGEYPTYHLLDEVRLNNLNNEQILISACRGEVIDNQALLELKKSGHGLKLVLDVWEGEPTVLTPLIDYTEIATAHIAGYSLEGKARGTEMLYQALCQHINIEPECKLKTLLPTASISSVELNHDFNEIVLNQLVKMVYDVRRDDAIFRQQLSSQGFDALRKSYPTRREFSAVQVILSYNAFSDVPHRLGFSKA